MRWILVEARRPRHARDPSDLAEFAERELRGRGIEIRTRTSVDRVAEDHVRRCPAAEVVPTRTLAWTAGVRPHPVVAKLGLPLDEHGRIVADRFMQVQGLEDVWAIGDAAAVPDPARKGQPSPPTASTPSARASASRATSPRRSATGRKRPFRYRTLGCVRRHGPPRGGGQHARASAGGLSGVVAGAHLSLWP